MVAKLIDGKLIAEKVRAELRKEAAQAVVKTGHIPMLAIIMVGDSPASKVYINAKEKGCAEVGIGFLLRHFAENTPQDKIIEEIHRLENDLKVSGMIVQLPLPKGFDEKKILSEIPPRKDVDGLHYVNMGKLLVGDGQPLLPWTPQGIMELIRSTGVTIEGKRAVVVGRSNIVGKPIALMLMNANATVTICHSRTPDLGAVIREADIAIFAVGKPKIIKSDMIKPGAIVIDVGTNRDENGKLVGDVDFEAVKMVAGWITPVPGGVGPMTVTMLLKNTIRAAQHM